MKYFAVHLFAAGAASLLSLPALHGQATPRPIPLDGYPVAGIEYKPLPAIYASVQRGTVAETSIEIINHQPEPLEITGIENPSRRFTARIEKLEPGKHYRLTVVFKAEGPGEQQRDVLLLKTNLASNPLLRIPVNTKIREKVYFFPASVFLGRFSISQIQDPANARRMAQILMVYRKGIPGFEIKVTSDLPLKVDSRRGPNGDQWENWLWLDPERAQPGDIKGTIFIETNDADIPKLSVPVTGQLQPK